MDKSINEMSDSPPVPISGMGKRACTFFIELCNPALTLAEIGPFLLGRNIDLHSLHLQCLPGQRGRLLLHCSMERDRIRRLAILLQKLPGVDQLEWLVAKGTMP